jgi:hypothetical protein
MHMLNNGGSTTHVGRPIRRISHSNTFEQAISVKPQIVRGPGTVLKLNILFTTGTLFDVIFRLYGLPG